MPLAIPRYGIRIPPGIRDLLWELDRAGQLVVGPAIRAFETAVAARVGVAHAQTASYGRMAFRYILQALGLPPGSEIVFPAFTFWVVPEMARALGFRPVFADVDPRTGHLSPDALSRAISARTAAVVPTHLWGNPCDLDGLLAVARRHRLVVIEDCAQAMGATYHGRSVGAFGDAAFFSFQTLKLLNTFGGGMAVTSDPDLAWRIRVLALSESWPEVNQVRRKLAWGACQATLTRPLPFTVTWYPLVRMAARLGVDVTTLLWERIRPLEVLPRDYRLRYSNAQAAIGLLALEQLDTWTERTRRHAATLDRWLDGVGGALPPPRDPGHAYYQYSAGVRDRDFVVRACARSGVDVETLHVDVCSSLPLFGPPVAMPGADEAARCVQVPVYASLSLDDVDRVGRTVAAAVGTCLR